MPFPLAHAAAVLPLMRRPFVPSALVAGAVAPDAVYLLPNDALAPDHTHEFLSVLWLDPLLALVLLAGFTLVVKRPLLALAPASLAARLPSPTEPFRLPTLPVLGWSVVSAVIGAFTHVLWDSFTHYKGYFVRHNWSFFTANVTADWDVNRVLQYVSTVGGCLVLTVWLYRWFRRTPPRVVVSADHVRPWVTYAVLAAFLLVGTVTAVARVWRAQGELVGEAAARLVLTGAASGCAAVLGSYVVLWHAVRMRRIRSGGAQVP
ncbi:DUF4184 family protein [Kribbella sandramycini]|uniref:DUF4184 family protein n=1 Tax=Kribbella sandramycini TaxID=60450 RepID=A0A7Y4KU77_9ACTN|nr:hypothetical protein [Kribbella sandramycini]NOL38737.1 DUF4184 family protein [Kribbella sandramycini]